ncbi:MAG TPA: TonB-dependent receptor, partial [Balneolales bacterium]|nr:TonB-dependent receptor [Balneolales bacterium]
IQHGGYQLSAYGRYLYKNDPKVPAPPGPYKPFGGYRWVFHSYPLKGSGFIQDKFETHTLVINIGARVDWFSLGPSINNSDYKKVWHEATGLSSNWSNFKYVVSPRFGISFPISVNTDIYFSYGHFNQLPEMTHFYRDPYSGSLTGNPHLDYVKTIKYEFGFKHQFNDSWAMNIKSYDKDISNQIGTTQLRANLGLPVALFDNKGYSRVRGLQAKIIKQFSHFYSGQFTYTLQWATGFSSSAFQDYVNSINNFPNPIRQHRLGYDVRHQIIFQGTIVDPKQKPMRPFGLHIPSNWNISILSSFSSGRPFTPGTVDPVERQKLLNAATGPVRMDTDLKFRKHFKIAGIKTTFLAEIFNIFNQHNVNMGSWFNNWTGKPFRYGDHISNTDKLYTWRTMYRLLDPRAFSPGRRVQLGIQINW